MDTTTYYCLAGLGADERIFAPLERAGISLIHIPWQEPFPREPIAAYAARLSEQINDPYPNLLGLSLGGMLAQVVASQRPARELVLLSTMIQPNEMPRWMRWSGRCRLDKVVPLRSYPWLEPIQNRNLGVERSHHDLLALVQSYRKDISPTFLRWAVGEILRWKPMKYETNSIWRFHGTQDRLFPISADAPVHWIRGGGHLAVYTHAPEIAKQLLQRKMPNIEL